MIKTRLTELLKIDYPIIQGAMAWISDADLVSAVCNAGATGVIATGGRSADWTRNQIKKTKLQTDKPFGVNIMLMADNVNEIIDVVCEEKVAFVTLGAGNPVPYIGKLKENGMMVIPVVPNLRLAKKVETASADAIIIEGMEAGGHVGTQTTMALLTNVIPEMEIPVISAGGIVDGRGIAAVLVMGASGVQMGSRFLVTEECNVHINVKEAILGATDTDSIVTGIGTRHAVRGLDNDFSRSYIALENQCAEHSLLSALSKGTNKRAALDGDIKTGFVQVGQSLTRLKEIVTVESVIKELIEETRITLYESMKFFR